MTPSSSRELEIFTEALQLPAEVRGSFLDRACSGDSVLRQRVEVLLKAHDEVGDFLEQPPESQRNTVFPAGVIGEKLGDWIGRYKLLQQIGEGGCGVVYMAEQEEPVRRRVALKVIKPGMDTRSVIARFEAERQALALMDHPNIAKVFDAGATASGRPYFVMELIRGIKITTYCDEQALSTEDRLKLFIQVCQAVQHAHQKGVIHRDLKPSNILVTTTESGEPSPVVIDFGIAKATTNQRLTDKTLFTAFEMLIGTPAYMSPEQAAITGIDVDTRTDIYSLGVLLYELLTGSTPFDGGQLLRAGLDEIRRVICDEEPMRPSSRLSKLTRSDLTTVAEKRHAPAPTLIRAVKGDLDWIAMKSLEKDRTRRYETANDLARDVQHYLAHEVVSARPPSALYRLRKAVRRNKLLVGSAVTLLVLLVAGLIVIALSLARERRARQEVDAALRQSKAEETKSRQVARFLDEMLRGVGPSAALGRDTAMLREILDRAAARLGTELADQSATRGELRTRIGGIYSELALFVKAEEMERAAVADYRQVPGTEEAALASALANLGLVLVQLNKTAEAETTYREALAIRRKLFGAENALVATTMKDLGGVYYFEERFAEAAAWNDQAVAIRRKLFGEDNLDVADSLNAQGAILIQQGKLAEAEVIQREVLAVRRKLLPAEHPLIASTLNNLGGVLDKELKLTEAEALLRQALAMRLRLFDKDHTDVVNSKSWLANVLRQEKKLDEAEVLMRQVWANRVRVWGDEHLRTLIALSGLAEVLKEKQEFAEAEMLSRQAVASLQKTASAEPRTYAEALELLGDIQRSQGELAEAETNFRQVVSILRQVQGAAHPATLKAMSSLGQVLQQTGKLVEADSLLREAIVGYRQALQEHGGASSPARLSLDYGTCLQYLATTLAAEGKTAEAEAVQNELSAWWRECAARGSDPAKS